MQNNLKIKPLTKKQILISIDRLTRFKNPEDKYLRVFYDIITQNLISPKYKKSDLDKMDYSEIRDLAQEILNISMTKNISDRDYSINKKIYEYECSVFKIDKYAQNLLKNKINYSGMLDFITSKSPNNLKWLNGVGKNLDERENRKKTSCCFPIEKLVIVEGATEEILLPAFAKIYGYDFDKEGVYVLPAGGKNQVVKLFYKYADMLNIPIFVLLDKDGLKNSEEINPKLRENDRIYTLNCGEFEDLLPVKLIKKTLEIELKNISILDKNVLNEETPKVPFLEETFKTRGLHEFKKVEFAQMIKSNVKQKSDLTPELIEIISKIREM